MPVVYHDPYEFSVEGASTDFIMQTSPEQVANQHDEK
jgi:hypothetical protein